MRGDVYYLDKDKYKAHESYRSKYPNQVPYSVCIGKEHELAYFYYLKNKVDTKKFPMLANTFLHEVRFAVFENDELSNCTDVLFYLVDTGATITTIKKEYAEQLGLKVISQVTLCLHKGKKVVNRYSKVSLYLSKDKFVEVEPAENETNILGTDCFPTILILAGPTLTTFSDM